MILNSIFEKTVVVSRNEVFDSCEFNAKGANNKDKTTMGITVNGGDVVLNGCSFANTGYSAVVVNGADAKCKIFNSVFDCKGVYNPVECTRTSGVKIADVIFNGSCGNNYMNFYNYPEDVVIDIDGVKIPAAKTSNNIMRISNVGNATATVNAKDISYSYKAGEVADDYTAFLLCQDYTKKSGKPQDFSKVTINVENLSCNGEVVSDKPAVGKLFYVYEDSTGIVEDNNPVVNI